MRPAVLPTISIDVALIDTVSDGSVLELAHRAGLLLEEERQYPALVRARLKRNYYEQ